jgi:hypothetical protein
MTDTGYLGALMPEEYGGMGLDLSAGCVILEEVNRSGANAGPAHAQMYTMGTLLRHGSEEQKREYLPKIARGDLRLQAFAVTEPEAGTDTTSIRTTARREGDVYVVDGRKIYISRVEQSDLMILLARTRPLGEVERRSGGLSVFLVDLREADGLAVRPRRVMMNNATSELVLDGVRLPANAIIGEEGEGFRYIIDGMNAEHILIAAECVGDGRWFVEKYALLASQVAHRLRYHFLSPSCAAGLSLASRLFEFGEYSLVGCEVGGAVEDEPDQAHAFEAICLLLYRPERYLRRLLDRVAEDPGRDGGEGDRLYLVLLGEREGAAVAALQKLRLGAVLAVDRPQSMDDIKVPKPVRTGHDGLARLYWAERRGFLGESRAGGAMDGPRDPAPRFEPRVRCVDHDIHVVLGGYVSQDALDRNGSERASHLPSRV